MTGIIMVEDRFYGRECVGDSGTLTVHSVVFVILKLKSEVNSSSDRHTLLQSNVCGEEKHRRMWLMLC